ncbi:MAG: hypothetical protein BWY06_03525 [Candidatus Latescibacteria bacterium ADurb.Bin168]|nr:MAG: hypothetical protein BWY06_03525 [Candidatus Latescibacteria bacterium ADurb.Bin168]
MRFRSVRAIPVEDASARCLRSSLAIASMLVPFGSDVMAE